MYTLASLLVGFVALLHLLFLLLEMFLWQTKFGLKTFGMTKEAAASSAALAKSQGLYNGFLAAGLIWSFFIPEAEFQLSVRAFFLICIVIAGIYGSLTAKRTILYVQALPALVALIAVIISHH